MATLDELKNILAGPHEYRNGQYVSTVPTPQEVAEAEAKSAALAKATAELAEAEAKAAEQAEKPKEKPQAKK